MTEQVSSEVLQAAFRTLLYSDIFDFPLTAREAHRYLLVRAATYGEVGKALNADLRVRQEGGYYFRTGRAEIVRLREQREARSIELLPFALTYGLILGCLPFVRMVALTGSLAVRNVSDKEDFDYMLVTQPGRLWTARIFVLLVGRMTRLLGHTICPNVIVSESCMAWSRHDLYSARELCQMIPISGMHAYRRLIEANCWVRDFLPNAYEEMTGSTLEEKRIQPAKVIQKILEICFGGSLGDRFEHWEMRRKVARFSRQTGFGEETVFGPDVCQGNFDHHRKWTQQVLESREAAFIESVSSDLDCRRGGK